MAVVSHQHIVADEGAEARPDFAQARLADQLRVGVTVYRRRPRRNRPVRAQQRTERVNHPAVTHLGGSQLDDLAAVDVQPGRFRVEGDVSGERLSVAPALDHLQRLENLHDAQAFRWGTEIE